MKLKATVYAILRWVMVFLAVMFLLFQFAGSPVSNADPKAVEEAVLSAIDMDKMQPGDNQMIKRFYGIDPSSYEYCSLYCPLTNMEAEEVLIVKLSDVSQADALVEAINARVETQKESFDGYGIEQYDMLTNNCVVEVRGNFVLFLVNSASADARQAFLDAL